MYLPQVLLVLLAVYAVPALALWPQLALTARTAVAIPLISILVVFAAATVLPTLDAYSPATVRGLSAILVIAASLRLWRLFRVHSQKPSWTGADKAALAVALAYGAYVALRLLEGGFDENDEIYSWNMWAMQHFLGEAPDYAYTQSPYPQLFPKLLSYSYMLLGSPEAQTGVKTPIFIFPVCMFFAIGLAAGQTNDKRFAFAQAVLCLLLLKGVQLDSIFDNGMPDALLATAITISAFSLFLYQRDNQQKSYLIICTLTAALAALTKQPGLLWALFSLPVLLFVGAARKQNSWRALFIGLAPALCAIAWIITEGGGFHDNDGVVSRSFENRGAAQQLFFSSKKWFLNEPVILLLTAFSAFTAFRTKTGRALFVFFVVPSLIMWLLIASYDLRAGAPSIAILALIIAAAGYGLTEAFHQPSRFKLLYNPLYRRIAIAGLLIAMAGGGAIELLNYKKDHPSHQIGRTQLSNLYIAFGGDADLIYAKLRRDDVTIWTPTNYVYGLFYGYQRVIRPKYGAQPYSPTQLMKQVRRAQPDYLTDGGTAPFGIGGATLTLLATQLCPEIFRKISGPHNQYQISVYALDKTALDAGACDL